MKRNRGRSSRRRDTRPQAQRTSRFRRSLFEQLEDRRLLATVAVNTTSDVNDGTTSSIAALIAAPGADGFISLREAILAANNTANVGGPDFIHFNIPGGGVQTIGPTSLLPTISDAVVIDGYTQPGASANTLAVGSDAVLLVEINGSSIGNSGLVLGGAGGSTVRGLVVNRAGGTSVFSAGIYVSSDNNIVAGNFIGTDAAGSVAIGNPFNGVTIVGDNNLIGGTTPAARNLISGNNSSSVGFGNVVVGAGLGGTVVANPTGTIVRGNYIGTNAVGTAAISTNQPTGIRILTSVNTTIGGADLDDGAVDGQVGARNVISGNYFAGIHVEPLTGVSARTIDGVTIAGNFVGVNASGIVAVNNNGTGIFASEAYNTFNLVIGGTAPGAGNVVSGNRAAGISAGALQMTVQGNFIGTDLSGTLDLGNGIDGSTGGDGIQVSLGGNEGPNFQVLIGGTTPAARNIISGNASNGVFVGGVHTGTVTIQGNYIGTTADGQSPLPNLSSGIDMNRDVTIGGTVPGAANLIAFNAGRGVSAVTTSNGLYTTTILGNSIHSNGNLGIDLNFAGASLNDLGDPDTNLINNGQNFPVLTGVNAVSGNSVISGRLNSNANSTYRIEFFYNDVRDPSGYGEGQTFLGFTDVTTDSSGNVSFVSPVVPGIIPAGRFVTATATKTSTSETSEFSFALPSLIVTNTLDSGIGSLREAITLANTFANFDRDGVAGNEVDPITFAIPGTGVQTITPLSDLPMISEAVSIDGYTQPGASPNTLAAGNNAVLLVELNGTSAGSSANGLTLGGTGGVGGSTVRGLAVNRFGGVGVELLTANNVVEGSYLGIDPSGTIERSNLLAGVRATNGANNRIGGTTPQARNVLAGNGSTTGTAQIVVGSTSSTNLTGTIIRGNYIGVNAAGSAAVHPTASGNDDGIYVFRGNATIIGGADADDGSVDGVVMARNIISGNLTGIRIDATGGGSTLLVNGLTIQGNIIGLDATGTADVGNFADGISAVAGAFASGNLQIGGTQPGAGNIISANDGRGFAGSAANLVLEGNRIGTDVSGMLNFGNGSEGVHVSLVGEVGLQYQVRVGGTTPAARNIISGSGANGVLVTEAGSASSFSSVVIQGNYIGTQADGQSPLPNLSNGVYLLRNATVGGLAAGAGNTIAFNRQRGVNVLANIVPILSNSIFSNGAAGNTLSHLGIDLGGNGVTPNDPNDQDFGYNNLQNFPVLSSTTLDAGIATIRYSVPTSTLYAEYPLRIEFFKADADGQEGQTFLGFDTYTAAEAGTVKTITFAPAAALALNDRVVATATDYRGANYELGRTSEFSASQLVTLANQPPVITSNGGGDTASVSVPENTTAVTTVTATDPDAGTTLTYSISGGADAAKFSINATTGALVFVTAPNYEVPTDTDANNSYLVIVQASDGSLTDSQTLTVTVANGNEPPTVNAGPDVVINDFSAFARIGSFSADAGTWTATVNYGDGSGDLPLTLNPDKTFSLNRSYANEGTFTVTVTVNDGNGGIASDTANVTVNRFTVDTTADNTLTDGLLTLREAIANANFNADLNTIRFNILGAGVHSIVIAAALPDIANAVVIDGFSQPGAVPNSNPVTEPDNSNLQIELTPINFPPLDGLRVTGGGSTLQGLRIVNFGGSTTSYGISLASANNVVAGCQITQNFGTGVLINNAANNRVGGATPADRVLVYNNEDEGVTITGPGATGNRVLGSELLYHAEAGVKITDGATQNDVGGSAPGEGNRFEINQFGVLLRNLDALLNTGPGNNRVQGNIFRNDNQYGVLVESDGNLIGGLTDSPGTGAGNLFLGGGFDFGIFINADDTVVQGNVVGVDMTGGFFQGLYYAGAYDAGVGTTIGGMDVRARNVFSGTLLGPGLSLVGTGGLVQNNFIGTDVMGTGPAGNSDGGIYVVGSNYTITGNLIAFNHQRLTQDPDELVGGGIWARGGNGNVISANSIFANDGLGIELVNDSGPDGLPLPNDPGDADEGPNNLQNFPVITSVVAGSTTVINGTLNSTANGTFRVEFFESIVADPSGFGEGQTYLGFTTVTTDGSGNASFSFSPATAVLPGRFISSTTTSADGSTSEFSAAQTVTVPVNQPPTITSNGGGNAASVSVPENTTAVTTVTATDPDAGTTLTYSIAGGADAARFSINSTTGVLTFATAPNFEAPTDADANNSYLVIVQTSDGSLTDSQTLTVNVTNGNESPTITSNGGGATASISVPENTTAVTTVTATDPDAGTTLTYSIAGGADAARFSINSTTGALQFITAPNFEAPTDADTNNSYIVIVQASDGSLTDSQMLTVTVTNANEPPTITSNGGANSASVSVPENTTAVTTVTATDPDAGTMLTYSIAGGADAARFSINSTTGVLTFVTAPDFESPTDVGGNNVYDVVVQASDGSLTDTQAISVTVTDVAEAGFMISGTVYVDVTGNGLTADDTPQAGVKVYLDTNHNGALNSGEPMTTTLADGTYAFTGLAPGTYKVREVVPTGYIRTTPVLADFYSVTLASGQTSSANHFSNAELCNTSCLTNVVYLINGTTSVSDLRGNTKEGDTIQVTFTVATGTQPQRFTFVSYTAPSATFDPNTASQQAIFDSDTGVFGPGTHTLTVTNPQSYFQIDFVCGHAIDQFGPAGSNIFYSPQMRLVSADNGGVNAQGEPAIDLALSTNVDNAAPFVGNNVALTVTVSNAAGWSNATGVRVKNILPSGLTYVSSTATQGTYNSSTGEWNLVAPLNSGASATLTITATVATGGEKKFSAQVTAAGEPDIDSTPNNDTSPSTPHNEDDDDRISIYPQLWTKYFVVNDSSSGSTREKTFEYAADGTAVENYQLTSGNTAPRGAATTAAGDKVWVVDANKKVYIYDAGGVLLGSWSAGGLASNATPEGIATDGTDVWIVDAQQDKVFKYTYAASRTSGSQNAASNFALNSGNKNPKDIVASSTHLWVVNDTSTDKVFKYTLGGAYVGSWTITDGGGSPTGITLDPANVNHLWIVDKSSDRVYQYNGAASRISGSQAAATSFSLGSGNTSPEGIADPPPASVQMAVHGSQASREQAFDAALLSVLDEFKSWSGRGRKKRRF